MNLHHAVIVMLALAGATACAPQEASLADVIADHTRARGGAEALDGIKSAAIDVEITENGQTFAIKYYAIADPQPLARVDVIIDGARVYSEGVDTEGVWLWPGDEPQARASVAEGSANALVHGVESNLVGLHRFAERGHALALAPREAIDGVEYYVVETTYSTGHKTYFYIDPTSWMITRKRDERAYHPDVDQTKQRVESRYSDFQESDGVVHSNRNEDIDLNTGQVLSTNRVLKRTMNPALPEGLFDRGYSPAL